MPRIFQLTIALIGLLLASQIVFKIPEAFAQSDKPSYDMILSKRDARMVFSLTRDEWNSNVSTATKAGVAKATGSLGSGLAMVTPHSHNGVMVVNPEYTSYGNPDFIQVIVAYRAPYPSVISEDILADSIEKANSELSPDYDVFGEVHEHDEGLAVYFVISESQM